MKLRLVKDEKMLLEVPLSLEGWAEEDLVQELLEARRDASRHRDMWGVLANERRARMMTHLLRDEDHAANFKEFQDELGMNPKSIREHAMTLHRCGLLDCPRRGYYQLIRRPGLRFMVLNLAFRKILRVLTEEEQKMQREVRKHV